MNKTKRSYRHPGSASLTTDVSGQKVAELRYLPFGETRWAWGTTPTDRRYTGQREVPGVGLYDYNARMYWPAAGRFVSADTVVPGPGNPQNLNRYAYTLNNPLRYNDPTGHDVGCSGQDAGDCGTGLPEVPWDQNAQSLTEAEKQRALLAYLSLVQNADLWAELFTHPDQWDTSWRTQDLQLFLWATGLSAYTGESFVYSHLANTYGTETAQALNRTRVENLGKLGGFVTGMSEVVAQIPPDVICDIAAMIMFQAGTSHGNSYRSQRSTYLYELIDAKTGAHIKWGITSEHPPESRYTKSFMADKIMLIVDQGSRRDMAARERTLTSSFPGPLNHEPWAGKVPWSEP